ncbi:MAG: hypothetical protein LBR29_12155, partial [Methylobacteriaceae bacterium]|nr:hypothetical protein [Methylobacteriaceae bacterium]
MDLVDLVDGVDEGGRLRPLHRLPCRPAGEAVTHERSEAIQLSTKSTLVHPRPPSPPDLFWIASFL